MAAVPALRPLFVLICLSKQSPCLASFALSSQALSAASAVKERGKQPRARALSGITWTDELVVVSFFSRSPGALVGWRGVTQCLRRCEDLGHVGT